MEGVMNDKAEKPDVEVVVRSPHEDLAAIGFWAEGEGRIVVAIGIVEPRLGESIAFTLIEAAAAIRGAEWVGAAPTPDDLRGFLDSDEKGEHPF
jgi:hypothetical protein